MSGIRAAKIMLNPLCVFVLGYDPARVRQQPNESFAWFRRLYTSTAPGTARWLTLGAATLLCGVLVSTEVHRGALEMAAILLASIASSIAGFAFSAICGAMLFHLSDDPVKTVQIMIACSIANQAAMTWSTRREIDWRGLLNYIAGGTLGLALGVWILLHADRHLYSRAFGILALVYGSYMLLRKPMTLRWQHPALDVVTGFLSGITGGAAGFPGAFVTIWCGMKGWNKARQRAVFQPFILIMQIAALLAISLAQRSGGAGPGFDPTNLLFVPSSLLGTALGLIIYQRLSDGHFTRAVNILLIVSGLSYVM
jgi:uncharacterized membrane protein YfcA